MYITTTTATPKITFNTYWSSISNLNSYNDYSRLKKYIINKNATIIFWTDGTKTISKRDEEDIFDKELGFLFAYFYKKWGNNKSAVKRVIKSIKEDEIKTFLLEFFMRNEEITREQAKKYLSKLEVSK